MGFNTIDCLESLHQEAQTQRAAGKIWRPPRLLSLEVEAIQLVDPFYDRLSELGYTHYKACRQFIFSPGPCETLGYSSKMLGCGSGPFGEASVDYLSGHRWRNLRELPHDRGFVKEFGGGLDWFDLHVKL